MTTPSAVAARETLPVVNRQALATLFRASPGAQEERVGVTERAMIEGHARGIGLADLELDMCRWPIGGRPFTFCGAPTRGGGSSYCAGHHRRAYVETARHLLGARLPRICEAAPPAAPRPVWQGPPAPTPLPEERAAIRVAPRQRRSGPPATPVVSAPRPKLAIMSMCGAATGRLAPAAWASPIATAPWLRVRLSPSAIIAMVARKAGITVSEIKSARRHADLVLARRVAVALLCRFTRLSLPQMGRALGGRDHTTIMHARDMARAAIGERDLPDDIAACADALFAALREGMRAVLIEREATYRADIARRMAHVFDGAIGRKVARVKARGAAAPPGALFGDAS